LWLVDGRDARAASFMPGEVKAGTPFFVSRGTARQDDIISLVDRMV